MRALILAAIILSGCNAPTPNVNITDRHDVDCAMLCGSHAEWMTRAFGPAALECFEMCDASED